MLTLILDNFNLDCQFEPVFPLDKDSLNRMIIPISSDEGIRFVNSEILAETRIFDGN